MSNAPLSSEDQKAIEDAANDYAYINGYPSAGYSSELHKAFMAGCKYAAGSSPAESEELATLLNQSVILFKHQPHNLQPLSLIERSEAALVKYGKSKAAIESEKKQP